LVAAGTFPDIIFAAVPVFKDLNKLNILADLNDLVKSHQVDLSRFDSAAVDTIKLYGDNGKLYALPFARAFGALFYNKDIFDKFGVAYPKDGMDWEQAAELARKVARIDNNTQYRGLEPTDGMRKLGAGLSLQFIDPKTEQATLNNDGWKRVLKQLQDIYNISNNRPPKEEFGKARANFVQRKNVAMITDWANGISGELEKVHLQGQDFNWDLVGLPNFKEKVGIGFNADVQCLLLSATTKHREQAFAVIDYLTSEEPQTSINKAGRPAAMNSPEMEKTYAANLESFKGKHISGIFMYKSAKLNPPTEYDQLVAKFMTEATSRVGLNNEDINTVLRETEEKVNAAISAEKTK
jgi:multiple sugar transport system substrate-binding protein